MSSTTINFTPVSIASTRSTNVNSIREKRADREARAKLIFADKQVKYLGHMPEAARLALAKGEELEILGSKVSKAQPGVLKCSLCSGVHNLTDIRLSGKITFFQNEKTKSVFTLSETCREDYLGGLALVPKLANPADYKNDFPTKSTK